MRRKGLAVGAVSHERAVLCLDLSLYGDLAPALVSLSAKEAILFLSSFSPCAPSY